MWAKGRAGLRISGVRSYPLAADAARAVSFGGGPYPRFAATLVRVETDEGLCGWGECIVRRAPRVTAQIVADLLAPLLLGRDPLDIGGAWQAAQGELRRWGHWRGFLLEAMSGVDIALWDIFARRAGLPLYKALAGEGRAEVPCYASSLYFAPEPELVLLALRLVGQGHKALKVKVGRGAADGGVRADIAAVTAVRRAVGEAIALSVDANSAYDPGQAVAVGRALAELGVVWLEEPVPPDDYAGYAHVRRSQPVPLAAGESEFGLYGLRELLARDALDVLQPDVARIGGLTGAWRVAALGLAHNRGLAPHTGFSGGVAQLASLHLAGAVSGLVAFEEMVIDNPLRELFTVPFPVSRQGLLGLPPGPGLGLELDWERVRGFVLPPASGAGAGP